MSAAQRSSKAFTLPRHLHTRLSRPRDGTRVENTSVAVFHPGTQHSWQTATALQDLGRLEFYATSIFYQPYAWPYRIERYLPGAVRDWVHDEFRRFHHPDLNPALVRTSGLAEWLERIASRSGMRALARRIDAIGNRRFALSMRSTIDNEMPFALWGYNSSSLAAFRAGKANGRTLILDRTIGDWRAYNTMMETVYQDYPDFFVDAEFRVDQATIDREDEEYALADVIVAGSPFAADTVRTHASDRSVAERVQVLNYCYDERLFRAHQQSRSLDRAKPLQFLFIGQAGPRKGIHLVLELFEKIPRSAASLTIVGDLQVPSRTFARYADRVTYIPTIPRADVPEVMAAADVLLFPSYFEGSALSLLEGLASGMALIQSRNAGVGVSPATGIMLPGLDAAHLEEAVMTAIEDRPRVEGWRSSAQAAAERYSFAHYRSNIASLLDEIGL